MRSAEPVDLDQVQLVRRQYDANEGTEIFLSFEDIELDIILGFLRLRRPSTEVFRPEIQDGMIIRELRVHGPVVDIGERDPEAWQHLGLGEKMISAAEDISRDEFDSPKILVNSGLGVKPYYRSLGYEDCGPYLSKNL